MSLVLDVKRVFSGGTKQIELSKSARSYDRSEAKHSKARHILGLDTARIEPARNGSTSSTSTRKLRSVTFSDATTARVSTADTLNKVKEQPSLPSLSHKGSSALLQEDNQSASPETLLESDLKSRASNNSLRSFYDKNQIPLSVSQQTSDSSSRDFALRRGAPSILTKSSQEVEHSKQLRLVSKLEKGSKRETGQATFVKVEPPMDLAQLSVVSLAANVNPERPGSIASQASLSRISITKGNRSANDKVVVPLKHTLETEHPYPMVKPATDPGRAKINVRRPKAGTKNWFDDVETESDEEDKTDTETRFVGDFASQVEAAFDSGRIDMLLPRSSSRMRKGFQAQRPEHKAEQAQPTSKESRPEALQSRIEKHPKGRKRKISRFEKVNLQEESVLFLSSSDEEGEDGEEEPTPATSYAELARREIRASLMDGHWDDSKIELGQALVVDNKNSEKLLPQLRKAASVTPPIPERNSSRMLTHLQNQSSDSLAGHDDLLTSFPRTPTDSLSRHTSFRESVLSESDSLMSTKLMTVTRQEENLIAAMRLKKISMKRTQAAAHRQDALKILELEGSQGGARRSRAVQRAPPLNPKSPLRLSHAPNTIEDQVRRHDSVTTFQTTDSALGQSTRSSIATYMTGTSEDLQLPYSSVDGLPLGACTAPRTSASRMVRPRNDRDTFLSEITSSSIAPQSSPTASEFSANVRGSHVVMLDPVARQVLREDIPSQLFMERPYLGWQGWEARANMQTAQ
ncbi:hypothetical protein H2198_001023 [Neophaeococcomyces mojaviensis]|uniref:Uncharacterized protein n=1 Tax=Neophaeococcomyces mojaviensis TaxID=3383035 RepID=A0ACC3AI29_9EURO|nr:hypothetical protein H2198_001023 [Knufia sp. JES_112]